MAVTTYISYTGDGSTTDFAIPFSYDATSEVVVTLSSGLTPSYTFFTSSIIRLSPAVPGGVVLTIERLTNIDSPKVVFKNGSGLTGGQLNSIINQLIKGLQEVVAKANRALYVGSANTWDMLNKRITNVGAPSDPNDAARLTDVQSVAVAAGNVPAPTLGQVGYYLKATGTSVFAWFDAATTFLSRASNLSDLANLTTARSNLGVYSTGAVDSAIAAAQATATASGATTGALLDNGGYKNRIFNPRFDIWQRGSSVNVSATNTYTADRWSVNFDGTAGTLNVSRQAFTLGQTAVPNNPNYFLRMNQSVAGTGRTFTNICNRIESVASLAGQQITISFWAKADAARTMDVGILQNFGTGGSPSSSVFTAFNSSVALTTSWTKYTVTGTLPSVSGKTLGSNNDDYCQINFGFAALGAIAIYDFADVQVEIGANATAMELRPQWIELMNCRRYYKTYGNYYVTATAGSGPQVSLHIPQMYKAPTVAGGGSGFTLLDNKADSSTFSQTTAGQQALTFTAEL